MAFVDQLCVQWTDAPGRRFFGIMAYPALARALKLVIDIEIAFDQGRVTQSAPGSVSLEGTDGNGAEAECLWMAATLCDDVTPVWTAAKLSDPTGAIFEPCTRVEYQGFVAQQLARSLGMADAPPTDDPPQVDGIVKLGARNGTRPRFSAISVELTARMEQVLNAANGHANAERTGAGANAGQGVSTARTAGLVILDSARVDDIHDEIQNADDHENAWANGQAVCLYAEDLTAGYALDVAPSPRDDPTAVPADGDWRSLMHRSVRFGKVTAPDGDIDVEKLVTAAVAKACPTGLAVRCSSERRLDEATTFQVSVAYIAATTSKRVGGDIKQAQIIAQETVATWSGDPLGLPFVDTPTDHAIDPKRDLPLPVIYYPAASGADRPPRLELGRAYSFGARVMFLGGVSKSTEEAAPTYQLPGYALLDERGKPYRFLRHESIAAPDVALFKADSPPIDKRGDSLSDVIVRSDPVRGDRAYRTASSSRVVFPRATPLGFAAMHPTGRDAR